MNKRLTLPFIFINLTLGACTVNTTPIIDRSGMYKEPPMVIDQKPVVAVPPVPDSKPITESKPVVVNEPAKIVPPPPTNTVETPACSDDPSTPAGFYKVRPKENLYRIALCKGENYENLARWNQLEDANQIKVGQLIRLTPPETPTQLAAVDAKPSPAEATKVDAVKPASSEVQFSWPYKGDILNKFNGSKNKGIDIAGQVGDPVFASARGKVVYVGNEVKGLGNLVIVKHNETYVTAYANNNAVLVQEGQQVSQGQAIAKVGSSGTDRVQLHFEIRKNGVPIDPETMLPK